MDKANHTRFVTQSILATVLFVMHFFSPQEAGAQVNELNYYGIPEPIVVPQEAIELRIYKQRLEIDSLVLCRAPKKGPSSCVTEIGRAIQEKVDAELVLKYNSVSLDGQDFAADVDPQGRLRFRPNRIDYSGLQIFEVEIIFLK